MSLSIPPLSPGAVPVVCADAPVPLPARVNAGSRTFAGCLSGACIEMPDAGRVKAGDAAVAHGTFRAQSNPLAACAADDTPVPACEPVPDLPHTGSPHRAHALQGEVVDASWPPDGLSSLLLFFAASAAVPVAAPISRQEMQVLAAEAGQGGNNRLSAIEAHSAPLPVADPKPADTQASAAHVPQWFAATRVQGIHSSVQSATAVSSTLAVDAPPPESTAPALPTLAAVNEIPLAAASSPETALVTVPALAPAVPTQAALAAPPAASASLPTPDVHAEHFPERIASHIHWMAEQEMGHARIHLHPREFGPVDVHLTLAGNQLHADFISAQPEVRQALEHSLPQLRHLLDQHGLQLAHVDVSQRQREQPAAGAGGDAEGGEAELPQAHSAPMTSRVLSAHHLLDAYA